MRRYTLSLTVVLAGLFALARVLISAPEDRPEPFDYYINSVLNKLIDSDRVKKMETIPLESLIDFDGILPNTNGTLLVLKTSQGRNAKLLVQAARQKVEGDKLLPVLLIDRYVTYKEGEEQTILSQGKSLKLYPGFRFSLDLGQVVPEEVPGDLAVVKDGETVQVKALDKVRLAVVTKYDKSIEPGKTAKVVVADPFEPKYFNGSYKLYDDGRRSGKLVLKVDEEGNVSGALYSDRDGARYELRGRVGTPTHSIQFTVTLPRTEQIFSGMLFTGDGKALAGTSRMLAREAGFYAVRIEE